MKVVVLGGSGFIGSHVVDRMVKENHDVEATCFRGAHGTTDSNVNWKRTDLRTGMNFRETDVVIHCAAITSGINDTLNRPHIHVADNVLMNTMAAVSAVECGVKHFIFLSSSLVYKPHLEPQTEEMLSTDFSGARTPYFGVGWMKIYAEKLMEFYANHSNTRFTILRPANIYGARDKFDHARSHVMGATIRKVIDAQRAPNDDRITMWGDGSEKRDFLYIDDLIDCVVSAMEFSDVQFEVFNVGTGIATPIKQLARDVIQVCGGPYGINWDESKPTSKTSLALDSSKARDILGWKPKVSLTEGIFRTYHWAKEHY